MSQAFRSLRLITCEELSLEAARLNLDTWRLRTLSWTWLENSLQLMHVTGAGEELPLCRRRAPPSRPVEPVDLLWRDPFALGRAFGIVAAAQGAR